MQVSHKVTGKVLKAIVMYGIPTIYMTDKKVVLTLDNSRQLNYFLTLAA